MCGRFHLATPPEDVATLFGLSRVPHYEPRYNIAPTQVVGVVREGHKGREWAPMQWGLVPSWAKDASMGAKMINARSETAAEKPAFRSAFKRRRCLVPASGFYEWQKLDDKAKQPMAIQVLKADTFAMAGLWEHWEGDDGELETFTILTCAANKKLAPIHDRMPVILGPNEWDAWLDPDVGERPEDRQSLTAMLDPFPASRMKAFPISRRVNSPANDDPSILDPVDAPPTNLFS
jgi:putative SOS response-associated peptidase YedK